MKEKVSRHEEYLRKIRSYITRGEDVTGQIIKSLKVNLEFWKNLKTDPILQINNEDYKLNERYLEFN